MSKWAGYLLLSSNDKRTEAVTMTALTHSGKNTKNARDLLIAYAQTHHAKTVDIDLIETSPSCSASAKASDIIASEYLNSGHH